MMTSFVIKALSKAHNRKSFDCGVERINRYFRESVTQDMKRRYATCFVACEAETDVVAGFYTLSSNSVPLLEVPDSVAANLPRYPTVPAVLIGWLGRDKAFAGQGLGGALLADAIRTVAQAPIGAHAIFADAVDDDAAAFYAAYGFIPMAQRPHTLYLPVASALALLTEGRQ